MKGYIQVYTGNGKGKTTAALGLALRAAGAGLKVFIAQFLKKGDYSEIKALARYADMITVEQYGSGRFIKGKPSAEDVAAVGRGIETVKAMMAAGNLDVLILEEANVAAACGLLDVKELLDLMEHKPDTLELVITGRGADAAVIAGADLVTEMQAVRHYYDKGVTARRGIEF